ncbi:MAG: tetratricopeptide repeat protein [Prolixibacteraceae bacterium]|nr:tetratricopeptide repeat protein [Prolixibacteraceae bacterium]
MAEIPNQKMKESSRLKLFILIISVLTLIAFSPVFNAGFVNWDDDVYVVENTDVIQGNITNLITKPVAGNFHPLTMISLAADYKISGGKASFMHIVNLFLHLCNIVLVFFFIYNLTGKKFWIAAVTSSLFAIHPLHVESVAWISERKDLLYSLFFLGGLLLYLEYIKKKDIKLLIVVALLSLLAMLSKPAAVVFPLVLIAVDYFSDRINNKKVWLEKIPFLLIAIIMGVVTLIVQKDSGAYSDELLFPFSSRILFASYGLMMYVLKTLLPINLCAFYPFPNINEALPAPYFISLAFTVFLIAVFIIALKKNFKSLAFAVFFYVVNLILVLQLLPVGSAVIADRYSYIPLIAPFFIIGFFVQKVIDKKNGKIPNFISIPAVAVFIVLAFVSRSQAATWKDGASLWNKAISSCPSGKAFSNRGLLYKAEGKTEEAFDMFSKAIEIDKYNSDALVNRANIFFSRKNYTSAIADYSVCIEKEKDNDKAFANRGAAYISIGEYDKALSDLNTSIQLNPATQNGYKNRALLYVMTGNFKYAIADYIKHLEIVPDNTGDIYYKIGYCFLQINDNKRAADAFSRAIQRGAEVDPQLLSALGIK